MSFRRGRQPVAPRQQLAAIFAATLWLAGSPAQSALTAHAAVRDTRETRHQQSLCEILTGRVTFIALWNGHVDRASRYAAEFARLVMLYRRATWKPVSLSRDVLVEARGGRLTVL